jgi:arsenate reductase
MADPTGVEGEEADKIDAFRTAFRELENRIKLFTALPLEQLDKARLQKRLDDIGRTAPGDKPSGAE